MDEIDLGIIRQLQLDGRKAFTEIAELLGVSVGTVRNRLARLLEERALQIVGVVDPIRLGYKVPALIGVSVQPLLLQSVAEAIAAFPEVSYLFMVSGEFDLFVEVQCRGREHLAAFLNEHLLRVPGVARAQTFINLKTYKMNYGISPAITHLPHPSLERAGNIG